MDKHNYSISDNFNNVLLCAGKKLSFKNREDVLDPLWQFTGTPSEETESSQGAQAALPEEGPKEVSKAIDEQMHRQAVYRAIIETLLKEMRIPERETIARKTLSALLYFDKDEWDEQLFFSLWIQSDFVPSQDMY